MQYPKHYTLMEGELACRLALACVHLHTTALYTLAGAE